jgi:hypothetical protein
LGRCQFQRFHRQQQMFGRHSLVEIPQFGKKIVEKVAVIK